jgi:hypothetical protein
MRHCFAIHVPLLVVLHNGVLDGSSGANSSRLVDRSVRLRSIGDPHPGIP